MTVVAHRSTQPRRIVRRGFRFRGRNVSVAHRLLFSVTEGFETMNRFLKSVLPFAAAAAIAIPAIGQVPVPPVPHLEIHIAHSHPPYLRHEVRPASPGPGYIWIA